MNRILIAFNFLGIVSLAVLCALQWHVNSQVTARADGLADTVDLQRNKLDDDSKTIKMYTADLEDFRQRLDLSEKQLKDLDEKLAKETAERNQIAGDRDNYKSSMEKWKTASDDRDKVINQAKDEIQKLADDRNDAVKKLNDLTVQYNALVKQWNDQQAKR